MSSILKSFLFAVVFFLAMLFGQLMAAQLNGTAFQPNWLLSLGLAVFVGVAMYIAEKMKNK
ncbi:MAG: hypothetical protein IKD85_01375 [Firmicutes bacterium]|nr:hypothetical protein [Bacillota bacterium]